MATQILHNLRSVGFSCGVLLSALFLQGCLITTHHFNTGRILPPGKTESIYAFGWAPTATCATDEYRDSQGWSRCRDGVDRYDYTGDSIDAYEIEKLPGVSYGWRLGIREQWGPFTGVDLGYLWQFPATLEFDVRLGLPVPAGRLFHHGVALGWDVGLWVDNTLFAEYGISRRWERWEPFINARLSWAHTQAVNTALFKEEKPTEHFRRWIVQTNFGTRVHFHDRSSIIPKQALFSWHLGIPNQSFDGTIPQKMADMPLYRSDFIVGLAW